MIIEHFPSLRAKPHQPVVVLPTKGTNNDVRPDFRDRARAQVLCITADEFLRRDRIVRQLFLDCPFHSGEELVPKKPEDFERYGKLTVQGIMKTYHDFHKDEKWPADDEPYILTTYSEKLKMVVFCTSGFLMRANNGGTC